MKNLTLIAGSAVLIAVASSACRPSTTPEPAGEPTPAEEQATAPGAAPEQESSKSTETMTASAEPVHVDAAGAAKLLEDQGSVVVLDVRTPEEYDEGHIDGALNIDFRASDFEARVAQLDKDVPYLVHCKSGGRSSKALEILSRLDFKNVYHLDGGMMAWESSGQSVQK